MLWLYPRESAWIRVQYALRFTCAKYRKLAQKQRGRGYFAVLPGT
jgi:hypothetical protein